MGDTFSAPGLLKRVGEHLSVTLVHGRWLIPEPGGTPVLGDQGTGFVPSLKGVTSGASSTSHFP